MCDLGMLPECAMQCVRARKYNFTQSALGSTADASLSRRRARDKSLLESLTGKFLVFFTVQAI